MEGPPALTRPLEGGYRPARLRAEGSARRVQEGRFCPVRRNDDAHRQRDDPLSLPHPIAAGRTAAGARAATRAAAPACGRRGGSCCQRGRACERGAGKSAGIRARNGTPATAAAAESAVPNGSGAGGGAKARSRGRKSGAQRSLPLRVGQKVQEMPRRLSPRFVGETIGTDRKSNSENPFELSITGFVFVLPGLSPGSRFDCL